MPSGSENWNGRSPPGVSHITKHPRWRHASDEKPKPKEPPAKLDTDPDVNTPTVCLSNVLELRRLAFLIAHEEGLKALQELFDKIESELCK